MKLKKKKQEIFLKKYQIVMDKNAEKEKRKNRLSFSSLNDLELFGL
jgi:hypothetical protein